MVGRFPPPIESAVALEGTHTESGQAVAAHLGIVANLMTVVVWAKIGRIETAAAAAAAAETADAAAADTADAAADADAVWSHVHFPAEIDPGMDMWTLTG